MMVAKQIFDDVILVRRDKDLMWRKIVIKIAEKVSFVSDYSVS